MATLQYLVFDKDSEVPDALQADLLKQAFTAQSFGSRKTAKAWVDQNGVRHVLQWLKSFASRKSAIASSMMLVCWASSMNKPCWITTCLMTLKSFTQTCSSCPICKHKAVVQASQSVWRFLYQHEETAVMEVVRAAVVARGKTVLANIHDAIITKEKLGVELMSEI